jgi:hypothetical protein
LTLVSVLSRGNKVGPYPLEHKLAKRRARPGQVWFLPNTSSLDSKVKASIRQPAAQ